MALGAVLRMVFVIVVEMLFLTETLWICDGGGGPLSDGSSGGGDAVVDRSVGSGFDGSGRNQGRGGVDSYGSENRLRKKNK